MIVTGAQLGEMLTEAERVIDEAGAYEAIESLLVADQCRPGRPREFSVRAMLVGLYLSAKSQRIFVTDAVACLNSLDARTRRRLGVNPSTGRPLSSRQFYYLFDRVARVLSPHFASTDATDESRYALFDPVFSALVAAGRHSECAQSASIALDASDIETWGTSRKVWVSEIDEETGETRVVKMRRTSDPDATWRGARDHDYKKPAFGFEVTLAVSVRETEMTDAPRAALAGRFRPLNVNAKATALGAIDDARRRLGRLGDVLVDREYTGSNDGEDFLNPIRRMGGQPVFDLKSNQVGPRGTSRGALIIDGAPYSPSLPEVLWDIRPPRSAGTDAYQPNPAELASYRERVAARAVYALVPHGARLENGGLVFECPGAAGNLLCPLQSPHLVRRRAPLPAANPPTVAATGSVCASRYKTFTLEDLPHYQRPLYGTSEWHASYGRRGSGIEPFFGTLKDEAGENVRRGRIRVMGLVKVGLIVAVCVASVNSRLAAAWDRRHEAPVTRRRRGRPRAQRRVRFEHVEVPTPVATPLRT